jgi:hypothetical protein
MGNELRKLMQQFGVSTPSMANYSGTQMPTKPPEAPTAPILAENATKDQRKQYDADLKAYTTAQDTYAKDKAAFDEQVRKYGLDKAQYDKYAADYQNRIGNTNMYNQAQFSTTGANVPAFTTYSDAQKAAMGMMPAQQAPVASPQVMPPVDAQPAPGPQDFAGTGQGGLNNYIQQYMGTNPSMSDMQDMQKRYGFNEYDVRNAMGTGTQYGAPQWQDSIKAPGYGITPITFGQMPDADRADWYNTQRNLGYTDADLRAGAEKTFGQMDNQNWYQMTGNAGPAPAPKPSSGFSGLFSGLPSSGFSGFSGLLRRGALSALSQNYAQGGSVKGYRPGGPVDMLYGGAGDAMMMGGAEEDTLTTPPPVDPMTDMRAMLDLYAPPTVTSEQIAAAAERRAAEQKAFEDILRSQLQGSDSEPQSKAEMYFRLAAAFGAPTKTGHFAENLALVGETMADQLSEKAKREREAREKKLGVDLEIQKMRMGAAGEDLEALQGLQTEEAKYRRDLGKELIRDYIKSGEPQSAAGKTAMDMGLKPGTPEFNAKVTELAQLEIERQTAAINAQIASMEAANKRGTQMTPTEINLRTETESGLDSVNQAMQDLEKAYQLNPNSYAGGLADKGVRALQETAGSDDPIVVNTRQIENLLGQQALGTLKTIFGGNPTEGERAILLELQGIGAKSRDERKLIMERLFEVLEDRKARLTTRLDDVISGRYKTYEETADGQ